MAAGFTFDPGKAVQKIAAIQIPVHNPSDMGAKEAVHPFKKIFIDLLQGFKVIFNTAILGVRLLFRGRYMDAGTGMILRNAFFLSF